MTLIRMSIEELAREKCSRIYTLVENTLSEIGVLPEDFVESNVLFFRTTKDGLKHELTISLKRGEFLCHGLYVLENCDGRISYQTQESFTCMRNAQKRGNQRITDITEVSEQSGRIPNTTDIYASGGQ